MFGSPGNYLKFQRRALTIISVCIVMFRALAGRLAHQNGGGSQLGVAFFLRHQEELCLDPMTSSHPLANTVPSLSLSLESARGFWKKKVG